ncbi:TPA: ADP-ribose diphosphatase [Salmonella enterica subsp. enterica serovar Typhi]|nr:ADP-ribose diphosphatase [Salmonella enterica subsp. enterica serovar Typhimurium]HCK5771218.1 ADP-ribose diphosphatase [Salmonella enterica subsp. enterica serovar Typhi str. CT18]
MRKSDNLPVTFTKSDVEIIARETRYRGFFSLDVYRFRHRLFNGEMSGEVKREIFERGHAAVLLPFDPERDEVVLVEQIRIAAYDTSVTPWLLEMVAGMIEEGETIEAVARREAMEEAGLTVGRTRPVISYLASPGGTSERSSILVAEVCSSQQIFRFKARYDYPNKKLHQRDEKHQINQFLADWLRFCLAHGAMAIPVY